MTNTTTQGTFVTELQISSPQTSSTTWRGWSTRLRKPCGSAVPNPSLASGVWWFSASPVKVEAGIAEDENFAATDWLSEPDGGVYFSPSQMLDMRAFSRRTPWSELRKKNLLDPSWNGCMTPRISRAIWREGGRYWSHGIISSTRWEFFPSRVMTWKSSNELMSFLWFARASLRVLNLLSLSSSTVEEARITFESIESCSRVFVESDFIIFSRAQPNVEVVKWKVVLLNVYVISWWPADHVGSELNASGSVANRFRRVQLVVFGGGGGCAPCDCGGCGVRMSGGGARVRDIKSHRAARGC